MLPALQADCKQQQRGREAGGDAHSAALARRMCASARSPCARRLCWQVSRQLFPLKRIDDPAEGQHDVSAEHQLNISRYKRVEAVAVVVGLQMMDFIFSV